jgi:hypothetical protein
MEADSPAGELTSEVAGEGEEQNGGAGDGTSVEIYGAEDVESSGDGVSAVVGDFTVDDVIVEAVGHCGGSVMWSVASC